VSEPLTVIARVRAKPGQEARLLQELKRLPAPTRAEAGGRALSEETNRVPHASGLRVGLLTSLFPVFIHWPDLFLRHDTTPHA